MGSMDSTTTKKNDDKVDKDGGSPAVQNSRANKQLARPCLC